MSFHIGARDMGFAGGGFVVTIALFIALATAFPQDSFSPENFPCHETEALLFVPDNWDRTECVSLLDWPDTPPTVSSRR
jgi:hypothetical protein